MDTPAFDAKDLFSPALRSIVFCFSIIVISLMTMLKPAHASGTLSTPPSLQYSVSWWVTSTAVSFGYYTYTSTPISCSASSIAGLEPCVAAVAGGPVGFYTYDGNYTGGNPGGFTDAVASHIGCPANSTGTVTCTCNDPYMPDSTATSCVPVPVVTCAAPSVPDGAGGCACNPPNRINSIGECTACPVDPLPKPPFPGDTEAACTASLEKGNGADIDKACRPLDTRWTEPSGGQLQCLADKIHMLGLAYTKPTATIRTVAYQQHLVDVWNKSIEIENKDMTPEQEQTCATVIANVDREMSQHGLDAPPSKKNSKAPHVLGIAIDIPRVVKDAMIAQVSNTTTVVPVNCFLNFCMSLPVYIKDVQDYINSDILNPPACNLRWGGRFDPYDPVHLQLF